MSVRLMFFAAASAALLAGGCASSKSGSTAAPGAASAPASASAASVPALAVAKTVALSKHGKDTVFTSNGFALYYFDPDSSTTSACTGGCADTWPPVVGPVTANAGLPASQFGTITRPDGSTQATFGGHPLYRYSGDAAPGDVTGDGIKGTWHLIGLDDASSAGGSSSSNATPSPTMSSSSKGSGGYGY
jgi:predicted lipoprotein with Yx(FWY)xxD motif